MSASCVTISNPDLLSSSKTGVHSGIRRWKKKHFSEWAQCQKAIGGIYFAKKWRAETLQPGLEFGNSKPRLKNGVFKCICWVNGAFLGGNDRGFLKKWVMAYLIFSTPLLNSPNYFPCLYIYSLLPYWIFYSINFGYIFNEVEVGHRLYYRQSDHYFLLSENLFPDWRGVSRPKRPSSRQSQKNRHARSRGPSLYPRHVELASLRDARRYPNEKNHIHSSSLDRCRRSEHPGNVRHPSPSLCVLRVPFRVAVIPSSLHVLSPVYLYFRRKRSAGSSR